MRDILRLAAAVPPMRLCDVAYNTDEIKKTITRARADGVKILTLPELCLTGYSCGDLFFQSSLTDAVGDAIKALCALPELDEHILVAVGAPLLSDGQLFNCAVLLGNHRPICAVPKTFLPNYREFYEKRWFSPAASLRADTVSVGGFTFPIGTGLLVETDCGVRLGMEICEDMWVPLPPSTFPALAGATVLLNLSASNEVISKRAYRKSLVESLSARNMAAYVYASAGADESTSDLIYSGHCMIAENGAVRAENEKYIDRDVYLVTDIDLGRLAADRVRYTAFADTAAQYGSLVSIRRIHAQGMTLLDGENNPTDYLRPDKLPFVPSTHAHRTERCLQIFDMQSGALARRLETVHGKAVIGISGGLDSTLALLVAIRAMEILGRPRSDVIGITMPCFGTTDHTLHNALALMEGLGVDSRTIPIRESVLQHFKDIGHAPDDYSVTYENGQARERTQVLMDVANKEGGIVVGTGDLSELALGWCTYNADHMSMYGVNTGVPKTLVRWVITAVADGGIFPEVTATLRSVIDTPISPELLPPDAKGKIAQITEDLVGPYALHDFFLYYVLRFGFPPKKIFELAKLAFRDDFAPDVIKKWLSAFYRRFFMQQFKRNCLPDGVKIGSVALSPRGDWRMPADATARLWLDEVNQL